MTPRAPACCFRAALGLLVLCGCSFTSPQREACYVRAHAALRDAIAQCVQAGYKWSECPDRDAALDRHIADQAACP